MHRVLHWRPKRLLIQWECNHILLGRDMVKRPQWLSTAPGFVESRDALKTRVDSFRQWEFQPDPSFCGYVWNSALTKRIRALFFDASHAALKTKMDFLIQWKCITTRSTDKQHAASYSVETLNLYPPCSRYVGNSSLTERILSWLTKRIRALFFDASRAALKTKMDFLIQWECNHILLGRDMVKRPQWLSTAPGFVESRDALKTKLDFLRQWEFQPDPSLSGYVWNSALTKRIRALFFDASRAALKTKMNFLIQWEL